ncbi:MAG: lipoyl(octanoyl) transferase LipB [Candidatus Marinimicrobia bacterium]|nr:lipoyl(octanoyl) transferase LipB [Candidatus Neomarinimicrobiota bacterium]
MRREIQHWEMGIVPYEEAHELQHLLMNAKKNGVKEDYLITLEHPHTYTIGSSGSEDNLLVNSEYLKTRGIALQHIGRGGDITYHGPGQLVAYPILDLNHFQKDLHKYLRDLEEVLMLTVKQFGITAERKNGLTGIWVNDEKLASIGIRMSKWITIHGSALNAATDLKLFDNIIPCGIKDKSVTSMSKILGYTIDIEDVTTVYLNSFANVFRSDRVERRLDKFLSESKIYPLKVGQRNALMA